MEQDLDRLLLALKRERGHRIVLALFAHVATIRCKGVLLEDVVDRVQLIRRPHLRFHLDAAVVVCNGDR